MLIRSRMGVSADGFVATPDGMPALALMPDFRPGVSHGLPEFISDCDAVVMGRATFLPALGAPGWPWPGLQVYVLTSRPLPAGTPADVIAVPEGPEALATRLRSRGSDRDVHLVGGPRTIRAFAGIGALDRLELVILPVLLGEGIPPSPPGAPQLPLQLLQGARRLDRRESRAAEAQRLPARPVAAQQPGGAGDDAAGRGGQRPQAGARSGPLRRSTRGSARASWTSSSPGPRARLISSRNSGSGPSPRSSAGTGPPGTPGGPSADAHQSGDVIAG